MPITIPQRLQEKLHSDSTYEGYIRTLIRNTQDLITDKAAFFPEYTIHGWQHIQAVLHHADKLIPDASVEHLTGKDAALLIAGVILHDLGMFLNEAGVRRLLTGPRRAVKTARLDRQNWKAEWDAYIHEIRRYPEEKLLYHFGMSGAIEEPDLTKTEFTDLERLVIGEFLRRHHHRIAHEIALTTMPGDTDVDVLQVGIDAVGGTAFGAMDRKCIGILARSHGMAVRKTWDYISREIGIRYKEKLTYLMAVLRIADALDADEQRAPDTVRKLQGIRIPVSVKEWIWNQRIERTDLDWNTGDDCKYVEAEPTSTTEFVHLEKWLESVQRELDLSWAILSEACDTQKYRLSIHRIDSNILEEERRESYSEQFITKEAKLNANPELLKLLVAPLYDNDPSCGVRELLQNAVDACNERAHLEGKGYRGQVEICLDTAAKILTVTDNGIGMDENVLLNYYLSAGASYRTSDEWFRNYAMDRDPNVVRTGRFGVGVLATFLLGNTVEVTTRHMDDEFGYVFQFGLEPEPLDIKRPKDAPEVGTTIKVTLKDDALEKLRKDYMKKQTWLNWYRFVDPSVRYWIDGEEYVSDNPSIPQEYREIPGWFELQGTEYEMVQWGYPEEGFFCNGIRIPQKQMFRMPVLGHSLPSPSVSVIDKKGRLPLDLARQTLQDVTLLLRIDDESNRYAMALILLADWSSEAAAKKCLCNGFLKYGNRWNNPPMCYLCKNDTYSISSWLPSFCDAEISILMIYRAVGIDCKELFNMLRQMELTVPITIIPFVRDSDYYYYSLFHPFSDNFIDQFVWSFSTSIRRVWSNEELFVRASQEEHDLVNQYFRGKEYGRITEFVSVDLKGQGNDDLFRLDRLDCERCLAIVEASLYVNRDQGRHDSDDFYINFIRTYMDGDPWIPYDMEERRKKFPKAFEELKYYIDRILADREKQ